MSQVTASASVNCRFLYLIGQLRAGGQERQLYYLLQAIDRVRYRPAVAVWNFNERDVYVSKIRDLGVPLYPISAGLNPVVKLVMLRRLIRSLGPEVIHSYSFYTNFATWWASLGTRAVSVGGVRSSFLPGRLYAGEVLGWLSARWPRHQICNSRAAAEQAQSLRSLFTPKRLDVVINGVDLQQFRASPIPHRNPIHMVGIGSLLPYKRWDLLLMAAMELKRRRLEFRVKIAGDGPLHDSLKRQIHQAGLEDCVDLLCYVDDVPNLLAESIFLVHTADLEGCPNVVLEAMASGRAVVATNAGDVPYIINEGITGFVVRRGDQKQLVERMVELIAHRELCQRMGQAGRIKAEREFSLARLVKETLAAYRAAGWRDN